MNNQAVCHTNSLILNDKRGSMTGLARIFGKVYSFQIDEVDPTLKYSKKLTEETLRHPSVQ